jgi:hypothetical protein
MKAALVAIALTGLAGCVDRDREWIKACSAGGLSEKLCECLAKKIPAEQQEKMVSLPLNSCGGGWVLIPKNEEAEYCEKVAEKQR